MQKKQDINPLVDIEPIIKRVDEKFESQLLKIKPDVMIDCVDNLSTRAILNHFAVRHKIPLISGGTDFQRGQVVTYVPGESSCLNCRLNVDNALVKARQSHSCIHAPTPSVVITNHLIGGLMAGEVRSVLDPENYGGPSKEIMKYDSTKLRRFGFIGADKPCKCRRKTTAKTWVKNLVGPKNDFS